MICFSSENLEDGEYTIKAGTGEDTITVSADQSERHSRHGKPDGRDMMPRRNNQQAPDTNSGSTPKMPGKGRGTSPSSHGSRIMLLTCVHIFVAKFHKLLANTKNTILH